MNNIALHKAMWLGSEKTLAYCLLTPSASIGIVLVANLAHADTTFTVNRRGDESEPVANWGNGVYEELPSTTGNQCSLRGAIQEANATAGADTIEFEITTGSSTVTVSCATGSSQTAGWE